MKDNKRGTIEDPAMAALLQEVVSNDGNTPGPGNSEGEAPASPRYHRNSERPIGVLTESEARHALKHGDHQPEWLEGSLLHRYVDKDGNGIKDEATSEWLPGAEMDNATRGDREHQEFHSRRHVPMSLWLQQREAKVLAWLRTHVGDWRDPEHEGPDDPPALGIFRRK